MKAIRIHEVGGPETLKYEDCPSPTPGPGQVLIDVQAIGVNFADTMVRSGVIPTSSFPSTIGREAAGVVSAVGQGVTEAKVGNLVTYYGVTTGAYAQQVVVPARVTIKLPDGLDARAGAALILQGMTAHCLAYSAYPLKAGDSALVHAGAGGTGLLLIQMAKRAGAYVFATVSTDDKAALVKEAGADKAIVYARDDFEEEINKATDGQGVQVVYDSVGKDTFEKSLKCLARRGCLATYGRASGPVPPVDPASLGKGSLFLTSVNLDDYVADREQLLWRAGEVMSWVASGELKLRIGGTFPLAEAVEAHR
jgi:NADPH2:quinone reductase